MSDHKIQWFKATLARAKEHYRLTCRDYGEKSMQARRSAKALRKAQINLAKEVI